jgi:hypothetical protein
MRVVTTVVEVPEPRV